MKPGIFAEQAAAKGSFEAILKAYFGPHATSLNRPRYWELPQDAKDAYWRCFRANRAVADASAEISPHAASYAATGVGRYVNAASGRV